MSYNLLSLRTRALSVAMVISVLSLMSVAIGCGKKPVKTSAAPAPVVQHFSDAIVGGSFIVEPGKYKTFKVVVTPQMSRPVVEGSFSAEGGNNDVEVFVLEESQYLNWQNGHQATPAYKSGRATAGKVKLELSDPATYYVIFSNRFSYIRNKAVTAELRLNYDRMM